MLKNINKYKKIKLKLKVNYTTSNMMQFDLKSNLS